MAVELRKFSRALGGDVTQLRGLSVQARDGSVGTVRDVVERVAGAYLVVDTGPWSLGRTVKLPAGVVDAVDVDRRCVVVDCTREDIRQAPDVDPDAPPDAVADEALNRHYAGRRGPELGDVKPAPIAPEQGDASGLESIGSGIGQRADTDRPEAALDQVPTPPSGELAADTPPPSGAVGAERRDEIATDRSAELPEAASRDSRESESPPSSGGATSSAPKRSAAGRRSGGGSSDEMPIARYDSLSAAEVIARLRGLSQRELAKVERYEKRRQNRRTVLRRVASLREDEPWRGYDEATVEAVTAKLARADTDRLRVVRDYERRHRDRKGVMEATRRALTLERS